MVLLSGYTDDEKKEEIKIDLKKLLVRFLKERVKKNKNSIICYKTLNNEFKRYIHFQEIFPNGIRFNVSKHWNEQDISFQIKPRYIKYLGEIKDISEYNVEGWYGYKLYDFNGKILKPKIKRACVMKNFIKNNVNKNDNSIEKFNEFKLQYYKLTKKQIKDINVFKKNLLDCNYSVNKKGKIIPL